MSDAIYIDQAAGWSKELTRMRSRGPGDIENAMRALERDYGIEYGFLWSLRYRRDRLKIISHGVFERIRAAYRAECDRQMRKLEHEISITAAAVGAADLGAARALVDEAREKGE